MSPTANSQSLKLARWNDGPEIFHAVQGEGPSIGRPSVFVRASRCNLHCVWCDTDYTWNWIGTPYAHARDGDPGYEKFDKKRETITLAADETARRISEFDCRNIVLTGGEPMLQQAAWVEVMTRLRDIESDYRFEVETNGTLIPDVRFDALACQYNVSPKLSNSAVSRSLREKEEALRALVANPKAIFKYVIATPEDLTEVLEQTAGLQTARDRVFLMPEGRDAATLERRTPWLLEACLRTGFRFSDRLHVRAFGDERGR